MGVMHAIAAPSVRPAPSAAASAVGSLVVEAYANDGPRVAIPQPEIQLVVRCGPTAKDGLDVHAMGARESVHRKFIRGGQWSATARLRLGTSQTVLGASAASLAGRIVPLEDLWGEADARHLRERLASAGTPANASILLRRALTDRCIPHLPSSHTRLALAAAERLASANVNAVAAELGTSERNLRRVFRETLGLSPKEYAKLVRFRRAVDLARESAPAGWASIAVAAGYYDQAHLIADFHAIAQTTPRALLAELRAQPFPLH